MDFVTLFVWEKKLKIEASCVGSVLHNSATCVRLCKYTVYSYLFVLYLRFPRDLQFLVVHFALCSMVMALRKKRVPTFYDRLKIIHEVEKNPGEKRVNIAKPLGLPASTLNCVFTKKNDIREQIQKCGNTCKKLKTGKESTFDELFHRDLTKL
jgi:hypothetical protein